MASKLDVDEIAAKNGTDPVALTKQHAAKAWIHLEQGSTHTNRDSFGISSITDNAAGTTTMSLTNSMSSGLYAIGVSNSNQTLHSQTMQGDTTSSVYRVRFLDGSGTLTDDDFVGSTIHGDLA